MSLLSEWRALAYEQEKTKQESDYFWGNYFNIEKGIYRQILSNPDEPVKGTVKALADKFGCKLPIMVGFLDGINDSLKTPNPIEEMTEDTEVSL
ncbi:MAG: SEC-C domain-containing protein, partial [Lachnospiraceae bacterium]|nr:SEC-C domain-containing protein [Lachnospiraceae bacterium]